MAGKKASKGKILVVDDKGIVAKDIARMLKNLGYTVTGTCMTPEDALKKVGEEKPDFVLMDIKLNSQKDGIDIAHIIMDEFHVPAIYLTAFTDDDTLERAKRTNPYGYIVKPFDEKFLDIVLQLAFERLDLERKLTEKDAIYKILVENSQGMAWAMDRNLKPVYISPSAKSFWGYTESELARIPLDELVTPDSLSSFKPLLDGFSEKTEKGQIPESGELDLELIRKDGSKFWGRVFFKAIYDDKNELLQIQGSISDVSTRLKVLRELESQRNNFLSILDRFPDFMYVSDPDTHDVLFMNTSLQNLLKKPGVGGKCYQLFHGKSEPCAFCTNEIIKKTKLPHVWDYYNSHLGRHLLITDQMITWHDGRKVRFETAIDITDQKKIEALLHASETKYRSFIEQSNHGFFIMNTKQEVTYLNYQARNIYGLGKKEPLNLHISDLFGPEDLELAMKSIRAIAAGIDVARPGVYTIVRPDGIKKVVEIQTFLVWKDGKLDGFHGTVIDITERKKTEQALIASEEKYRSLFENSPEAIVILGKDGKIIECNNATAGLMEKKIEEIIGKRFDELGILDSTQSEFYGKMFMAMTEGKEMNKGEIEIFMKGGRSKWIEAIPSIIARAGEFYGIQMIARDITDRKLADIELRKKLMKFDIESGNVYLSKESSASHSLEAFKELLMVGNEGLLISRKSRKDFQNEIDYAFNHVKVSETDKENHVKPDYNAIHQLVSNLPRGHVIHIDCIEYLISWIGANKTIIFVQYLKDLAISKGLVVLLSIDPKAIPEKELRLIEKESVEMLPSQSLTKLSQKILDILKYIDDMNREGTSPSYSDISEYFELSKPTARNRIRQLHELGTVKEIQRGRMKILELTEKGKNYLIV